MRWIHLAAGVLIAGSITAQAVEVDGADVLDTLRAGHPRLQLTADRLDELKAMHETDPALQAIVADALDRADGYLDAAPLKHELKGPRLLGVSRDCLRRVYALALAWRWTGEEKYAVAAESNMITVAAFPDWNPSHFLDVAEMTNAVATGYDWLYDRLSAEDRETIKTAIIELGLKPGIEIYEDGGWWTTSEFNWNNVCNGGMVVGALAVAETDPEYAEYIIPKAAASLPRALKAYNPDGAWMEGPAYWHYATRYTAYGLNAMLTALGTDFGLSDMPGLRVTGLFPDYTTGPTGLYLNYADSGERSRRKAMACMFWLASHYGNRAISNGEHAALENDKADPEHVVWYVPPTEEPVERTLDKHFRSPVDIVIMRSAWDDPEALFVGVKGGYNQVAHGHLDLGNFELDALGVRWARDLGSDNYNLDGYWDKKAGGQRWDYYRLNSQSHNVVMLGGDDQDANAVAKILSFESADDRASVSVDLTSAYSEYASKAIRDVALTDDRTVVVVRDTIAIDEPCALKWGMTTDASIAPDGQTATLTIGDKHLIATIRSPEGAVFSVESAEQEPPERANKGVNRLAIAMPEVSGDTVVEVELAPVWAGDAAP